MIPYLREGGEEMPKLYRHWGIYAYRREALKKFVSLPPGALEKCEKLEQLRALENGMRIKVLETAFQTIGIDTPEDLKNAEALLASGGVK
jgi:3-deoxy-manno-octulosonate cytidylyltransferase (CMP-KDO synthetase)